MQKMQRIGNVRNEDIKKQLEISVREIPSSKLILSASGAQFLSELYKLKTEKSDLYKHLRNDLYMAFGLHGKTFYVDPKLHSTDFNIYDSHIGIVVLDLRNPTIKLQ